MSDIKELKKQLALTFGDNEHTKIATISLGVLASWLLKRYEMVDKWEKKT